jgi:hypothetical protein
MGSPLSPIVADIVMRDLEECVLKTVNVDIPFYFRYVDDILLATTKNSVPHIVNSFNSYHHRINFTTELEENRCLSFLDLKIIVTDNILLTDWFHKKTYSGRLLSFFSNHPQCHKIGIIYNLIDRAIILSHPKFHKKNIEFCIDVLLNNGYPIELIFKEANRRIKKLVNGKLTNNSLNERVHSDEGETVIKKRHLAFPYIKGISDLISPLVDKSQFSVGYRCLNKLDKIVKVHKDKNLLTSNNNVVYKICCMDCDSSYVGQTKRQLNTRLKEHKNNIKLDPSKYSVVTEHSLEHNHTFDWNGVRVLDSEVNYRKRLISEMLHIKQQKNGINLMKDTELLDSTYFDILRLLSE